MSAIHVLRPFPQHLTAAQIERAALRSLVREFIRAVPAGEPDAVLEMRMPDGQLRQVTRGVLSARIRWLRPRMRRIVERQIIGHVSREQVATELGVSMKTLERDQQEALDILLGEATDAGVVEDTEDTEDTEDREQTI